MTWNRQLDQIGKFALLALLLTGCATTKPPTVSIPVAVGCVGELPARPVNTFSAGGYPGGKAAAQAALIDSAAWEGYATKLEVVIAGCPAKTTHASEATRR